jgi:hypothetical protein
LVVIAFAPKANSQRLNAGAEDRNIECQHDFESSAAGPLRVGGCCQVLQVRASSSATDPNVRSDSH